MTYALVHTEMLAARTAGDKRGKIEMALIRKAALRADAIGNEDKLEAGVCREVLDGSAPASWTAMVLIALDIQGQLANPTDAQINDQVDVAWGYFLESRKLT